MNSPAVTIIGGGSVQWAPNLIVDVLLQQELRDSVITLHDIDPAAANLVKTFGDAVVVALDVPGRVRVEDDLARALEGADYIIIVISTGGLDAMSKDLLIPESFGVFHTVGDTCGPGGWSRFIRNFPVFVNLARAIRRYAPEAVVLNYTNPMTTLTGVLSRELDNHVIGLCHGLYDNYAFLTQQYDAPASEINASYAGLNHFFWMTEVTIRGIDVVKDLSDCIATGETLTTLEDARSGKVAQAGAFHSRHELATELMRLTGTLPFLEDRHTSEFVPWGIIDPDWMRAKSIVRTTIAQRFENQERWTDELTQKIKRGITSADLTLSGEGAAETIVAHRTGLPHVDVGNVPNRGQISNLPLGIVVETAVCTDRAGFTPLAFGDLPPVVHGLVEPHALAYQLLIDACYAADSEEATRALRLDPALSHLPTAQVNELAIALITANGGFPGETHSSPRATARPLTHGETE
jgi:alpha-galactosidase